MRFLRIVALSLVGAGALTPDAVADGAHRPPAQGRVAFWFAWAGCLGAEAGLQAAAR